MKLLDIVHPAAKTLCDISLSQDAEVSNPKLESMKIRVQLIIISHTCFSDQPVVEVDDVLWPRGYLLSLHSSLSTALANSTTYCISGGSCLSPVSLFPVAVFKTAQIELHLLLSFCPEARTDLC